MKAILYTLVRDLAFEWVEGSEIAPGPGSVLSTLIQASTVTEQPCAEQSSHSPVSQVEARGRKTNAVARTACG